MAKKHSSSSTEDHAASFFGPARQFQKAADLLPAFDGALRSPINVLYFHAIELALKAFLRVHNVPIMAGAARKHHRLTDLFKECCALRLKISRDDQTNIGNIVSLFDGANKDEQLLTSVEPHVNERAEKDDLITERAVKIDFVVRKPEEQPRK